ncbi:MAG: hypothetical protein Ta2A_15610 [Treponemataceae bacterium]|nr:MAG: hypothetical protein Ta2A_15610 [Treponemataceae bacterium]
MSMRSPCHVATSFRAATLTAKTLPRGVARRPCRAAGSGYAAGSALLHASLRWRAVFRACHNQPRQPRPASRTRQRNKARLDATLACVQCATISCSFAMQNCESMDAQFSSVSCSVGGGGPFFSFLGLDFDLSFDLRFASCTFLS